MIILLALLLLLPTVFEAWTDRHGETKEGKKADSLWLLFVAALLSAFLWKLSGVPPWKTLALLLGWRILVFDYLVAYLLIKNDVIVGNWWNYTGKTSKFDWFVSKIDWRLRIVIRAILFAASLWWFLSTPT